MTRAIFILALLFAATAAARNLVQDEPAVTPDGATPAADFNIASVENRETVSVPTARLRRNSASQAAAALKDAVHVRLMAPDVPQNSSDVSQKAICGTNSLMVTSFNTVCRIVATFRLGTLSWSKGCSGAKMASNRLATAGHCVYDSGKGGFAKALDVYCASSTSACSTRTTTGTNMATTPSWVGSSTTIPTAWDLAVIRTAGTLPGTAFSPAQYNYAGAFTARLSGFPGRNPNSAGCNNAAYTGCTQYSSTDTLTVTSSGMYTSNKMDLCSGHSGGGVINGGTQIVAVVSGESLYGTNCVNNLFAPQINAANVNPTSCERAAGGASLNCMSNKLPA